MHYDERSIAHRASHASVVATGRRSSCHIVGAKPSAIAEIATPSDEKTTKTSNLGTTEPRSDISDGIAKSLGPKTTASSQPVRDAERARINPNATAGSSDQVGEQPRTMRMAY